MSNVLDKICADKRNHVDAKMRQRSLNYLKALLKEQDHKTNKPRGFINALQQKETCLLYTSPSPRDRQKSRMPSSA